MDSPPEPHRPPPASVFLGYRVKQAGPLPEYFGWQGSPLPEVCSASGCIARHATGWFEDLFERPGLNRAACTATAAEAWERAQESERPTLRLFAYRAIPLLFDKQQPDPVPLATDELFSFYHYLDDLPAAPDATELVRLGFDVVQYSDSINWGCSPLTCNYMYQQHPVNASCLLDTWEQAERAARAFASEEPEPGPYLIVEVLGERASTP